MYIIDTVRNGERFYDMGTMMALQVYAANNIFLDEGLIFPYRPKDCIQVGRYQNTVAEINQDYVQEKNLEVVRRDTGGGTLYMDRNHANFVFLLEPADSVDANFDMIYEPAIRALKKLGVKNVRRRGRNDLEIDGYKVSGAAQSIIKGRLYAGYSLIFDADTGAMDKALTPSKTKMKSRGIDSVRKRVTTIHDYVADQYQDMTPDEFSDFVLCEMVGVTSLDQAKYYELSEEEWAGVDKLVEEKYANWDWNYGASPRYEFNKEERFKAGTIQLSLDIDKGRIDNITIRGDFFGSGDIKELENQLKGCRVRLEDLVSQLNSIDLDYYIAGLSPSELAQAIVNV